MYLKKYGILTFGIFVAGLSLSPDACAQNSISTKARQKASWYNAPHEIQIIDERPVVRDFREAPSAPSTIQLPPGPQGFNPLGGGGGGGAMGDGGGGDAPIPAGGMQIGDPGAGYRSPISNGLPLERSGFGRNTNIPAGGIRPKGVLPNGQTTGVHGSLLTPMANTATPTAGAGAGNRGAMAQAARPSAPAASYGGNYTHPTSSGSGYGGGGMNSSSNVSGKLLNRLRGN